MRVVGVEDLRPDGRDDTAELGEAEVVRSGPVVSEPEHGGAESLEPALEGTAVSESADGNLVPVAIQAPRERDHDALEPANPEVMGHLQDPDPATRGTDRAGRLSHGRPRRRSSPLPCRKSARGRAAARPAPSYGVMSRRRGFGGKPRRTRSGIAPRARDLPVRG